MAGVTNVAFRTLCRELEIARAGTVSGLYVCEMVTARALVERHPVTMHMTTFAPDESPRSLQLYTVDPDTTYAAAKMIVDEGMADHIDMNFGCPVPKVTRRGGGAALPYKRRLFGQIVAAAVRATEGTGIPVTVKFRIGIDDAHHTHLDAGRIAAEEGAAAVALHARTAAQRYSGSADWEQIALLKQHVTGIPVLGNGDIFDADDALAMMAATGCDGVVIGRGCLGRPWLFAELSAAFTGREAAVAPTLGEVADIVRRHGELLAAHFGEDKGMREIRKHVAWYLHGFPAGAELRRALALVKTLAELDALLDQLDPDVPFPAAAQGPRGRQGSPAAVALPDGWLRRSRRLHGARGRRPYALRRLNRDDLDITSLRMSQYDMYLVAFGSGAEPRIVLLQDKGHCTPSMRTRRARCSQGSEAGRDMSDGDNATPGRPPTRPTGRRQPLAYPNSPAIARRRAVGARHDSESEDSADAKPTGNHTDGVTVADLIAKVTGTEPRMRAGPAPRARPEPEPGRPPIPTPPTPATSATAPRIPDLVTEHRRMPPTPPVLRTWRALRVPPSSASAERWRAAADPSTRTRPRAGRCSPVVPSPRCSRCWRWP